MTAATLLFLGTSDSQGVPRWWCDCAVCHEARTSGVNRRTRSSAVLERDGERILLDFGPDFHAQTVREGVRGYSSALLTHAHNDHLLGLGDLIDRARHTGSALPIYAPGAVLTEVVPRFPYAFVRGSPLTPLEQAPELAGFRVSAFQVPHGFNGVSYGLRFDSSDFAWVYLTDSIGLPLELQTRFLVGLDLLVLGTSFWHEDAPLKGRSVYDVTEALELEAVRRTPRVLLTHLGHGIDLRHEERLPPQVRFAREGQRLALERDSLP